MELSNSHSSPSMIIPRRCKISSHNHKYYGFVPKNIIKSSSNVLPSNKYIMPLPMGLYGKSRSSSKSLLYDGQYKPNSIKACTQVEFTGPDSDSVLAKIARFGSASYKFTRPYALNNIIISAICLFARVLVESPQSFTWSLLFKAFFSLIAMILAGAYFNGINQIFDVEIDRINKPYLPIAAGELSIKQAWLLVIFDLLAGLLILRLLNADFITISLYCLGLFFSTTYSAPPFRFKSSSIATIIVIPLISAVLQNVGMFYAARTALGLAFWWSPQIVFLITSVILFFVVISITKDITEVEGDMKHNIRTFAAIFGPRNISFLGTGMLLVNYIGAIVCGIYMPKDFNCYLMLPAHAMSAMWLLVQARKLDKANYTKEASANFYQLIWKLLYLEFLLFPFL